MGIKKAFLIEGGFHGNAAFFIVPQGLAQISCYHLYVIKQTQFFKKIFNFGNQSKSWVFPTARPASRSFPGLGGLRPTEKVSQRWPFKTSSLLPGVLSLLSFFSCREQNSEREGGCAVTSKEIHWIPA